MSERRKTVSAWRRREKRLGMQPLFRTLLLANCGFIAAGMALTLPCTDRDVDDKDALEAEEDAASDERDDAMVMKAVAVVTTRAAAAAAVRQRLRRRC